MLKRVILTLDWCAIESCFTVFLLNIGCHRDNAAMTMIHKE